MEGGQMSEQQINDGGYWFEKFKEAQERIKRLEDVGNSMAAWLSNPRNLGDDPFMASQWRKAKEAKL
jgi:hypothetical protein